MAKQGRIVFSKPMWLAKARKDGSGTMVLEYGGMCTVASGHRDLHKEVQDPDNYYWYTQHEPPSSKAYLEWKGFIATSEADELYQKYEEEQEIYRLATLRRQAEIEAEQERVERELFSGLDNFLANLV